MIEPSLALQTALRTALIGNAAVTEYVAPENIRSGSIRAENMPAIVLTPARVELLGRASGGQIVAEVRAILHIWVLQDGSEVAQAIAGAVLAALMDAPAGQGFTIDEWDCPQLAWMPDPDPARSFAHGAVSLRAVLRWRADVSYPNNSVNVGTDSGIFVPPLNGSLGSLEDLISADENNALVLGSDNNLFAPLTIFSDGGVDLTLIFDNKLL